MNFDLVLSLTFLFIVMFCLFKFLNDKIKELEKRIDFINRDLTTSDELRQNLSKKLNEHEFKLKSFRLRMQGQNNQLHTQRQRIAKLEQGLLGGSKNEE